MTPKDPSLDGWNPRSLDGFFGLVGPLWTRKEEGTWAYGFMAEPRHTNPAGVVHGGMLVTLIDHALSAIAWEANERRPCVTVQLDTAHRKFKPHFSPNGTLLPAPAPASIA